jgi:hypothetical protein
LRRAISAAKPFMAGNILRSGRPCQPFFALSIPNSPDLAFSLKCSG